MLWLLVMVLAALVVALTACVVQVVGGARGAAVVQSAALAFGGALTLGVVVATWLGQS